MLLTILGCGGALPPAGAAETELIITNVTSGTTYQITPENGSFRSSYSSLTRTISIDVDGGGLNRWSFRFTAPFHAPLKPGLYPGTQLDPAIDRAGFDLNRSPLTANVEVKKSIYGFERFAVYGFVGSVTSFWATFEQLPDDSSYSRWRGELKLAADALEPVVNQAPGVYAGPDRKIMPGTTVALAGQVADDGLPATGHLTTQWSVSHGPGPVVLANPAAAATTATFSKPGKYLLVLTASDGAAYRGDEIQVEVLDPTLESSFEYTVTRNGAAARTFRFSPFDIDLLVSRNFAQGIDVKFYEPGSNSLRFVGPNQAVLRPGKYENAGLVGNSPGRPALDLSLGGMSVGQGPTRFEVLNATYGVNGEVVSFHATFEQRSANPGYQLSGEVRYRVPTDPPPVVRILPAGGILPGRPATLRGEIADVGLSGPLTTLWECVGGPAAVHFDAPTEPITTAVFPKPGAYRLRLTASDGRAQRRDEIGVVASTVAPQLVGVVHDAAGVAAGWLALTLPPQRSLTGSLLLHGRKYGFSGRLGADGRATVTARAPKSPALRVELSRTGDGRVQATIPDGTTVFSAALERLSRPAGSGTENEGRYLCILPAADPASTAAPAGTGWARLDLAARGTARLTGTLADGTAFVQTGRVTESGGLATFSSLPRKAGHLALELTFTRGEAGRRLAGMAGWRRPTGTGRYPAGFATLLTVEGEPRPTVPATQEPFNRSGETIPGYLIAGGAGRGTAAEYLQFHPGGAVTAVNEEILALAIDAEGFFQGTFTDSISGATGPVSGVILPSRRAGYGFFHNDAADGFVELEVAAY